MFAAEGSDESRTVRIATKSGSASTNHGIVTATILEGAGYVLANTVADNQTSFVVIDDLPAISISEIGEVNESAGNFTVTLVSDTQAIVGHDIVIDQLIVNDANSADPDYNPQLPDTPIKITNSSTNNSVDVMVTFTKEPRYIGWDILTVSLFNSGDYTAKVGEDSRRVTIREEQLSSRQISISAPTAVIEGEDIVVTLTSNQAILGEVVEVELSVSETSGTFLDPTTFANPNDTSISVLMTSASLSEEVTIRTRELTATANGTIQLSIMRDDQYEPASTTATSVTVQEEDLLPTITITRKDGGSADIVEGTNAVYSVSAANPATGTTPIGQIQVNVGITQVGNFLDDPTNTSRIVRVMSGASEDLIIMTDQDENDEENGSISAMILPDMPVQGSNITYLVGAPKTATIGIADNDNVAVGTEIPTISFDSLEYSIGEASGSITIPVILSGLARAYPVTANWSAIAETATSADFTTASGTLTINRGTTGQITIDIADDQIRRE